MLQRQVAVKSRGSILDAVDQQVGLERVPCAHGRDRAEGEDPVDMPDPLGADHVPKVDLRDGDIAGRGQRDDRLCLRVREIERRWRAAQQLGRRWLTPVFCPQRELLSCPAQGPGSPVNAEDK